VEGQEKSATATAAGTPQDEGAGDRYDGLLASVNEARERAVKAFIRRSPQEVTSWLGQRIEAAQYVTNGLQMATQVSEVGGIAQAAINASIDALEAVKAWVEKNCVKEGEGDGAPPPELSEEAYRAYVGEDERL
jgi:hypothetical protein